MNASDEKMLQDFLNQLVQAKGITKDPDADAAIQRAVSQQPDATYLLVQRALLVEQALNNAKARIAELEKDTKGGSGFLDANAWGNSAQGRPSNPVPGMGQGSNFQPSAPAKGTGFMSGGGGGSSMLGTIAATAAGVAAGSFLFHGIGNLLGNDGPDAADSALADNAAANAADEPAADASLADNGDDSLGGFFDGDGSDEGLFG